MIISSVNLKAQLLFTSRGNFLFVCNSAGAIGSLVFNGVKIVVVDVALALWFFFRGVTHEWISSIFEVLILFLFVVMSLLSS